MGGWHCTREQVKAAADVKVTARNDRQIDRLINASTDSVTQRMHRTFLPKVDTRIIVWDPFDTLNPLWRRVSLLADELVTITSVTLDGVVLVAGTDYRAEAATPITYLEFPAGTTYNPTSVLQVAGKFGYRDDSEPAGLLAAAITTTSQPTIQITNASVIGVGQVIKVDSERMFATEKGMLDTGQNLQSSMTALPSNQTVQVTDGTAFATGEVLLIDAERMLIVDIAGNNLIVIRAWDGTTLDIHTAPTADIYAQRLVTVERGVLGTTAATHSNAAPITKLSVPGLIEQLSIAEAVTGLMQENSSYARVVGSGDNQREAAGKGLEDLREQAFEAHGRKVL